MNKLLNKYNVPVPRYTSFPAVPFWQKEPPSPEEWYSRLKKTFDFTNSNKGISLYIHLPYCESMCTYCGCNTRITVNHKVEIPYIESLLKEWDSYVKVFKEKPLIKEIHLGGGTPTFFSPENLKFLIESILNSSKIHSDSEFSFEAHPGNTTKEHLQVLSQLGFRRLSLGIQDFDPKVQKLINRQQSFDQVQSVVTEARKSGYKSINFDLIYGLPGQKLSSIQDTISKVGVLKPERIALYSYAHVPWVKPGQRSYSEKDLPSGENKRKLYELSRTLLEERGYREIGMDHFSLPTDSLYKALTTGSLHRNFMGYTTTQTDIMLGLGVSSISDCGTAFVQNCKTVEDYNKKVNHDQSPIFKGHLLSDIEVILGRHIRNLICHYKTTIGTELNSYEYIRDILIQLNKYKEDGLVTISGNHVRVTETGKPFIRNICSAFDPSYLNLNSTENMFSKSI